MYSQDINHNKIPIIKVTPEQLGTVKIGKPPQLSKIGPSAPKKAEASNFTPPQRLIINK